MALSRNLPFHTCPNLLPEQLRVMLYRVILYNKQSTCDCLAQYSYAGTATDKPLLRWLDEYTFPSEARHADLARARSEHSKLIARLLGNGTTTAMYFATLSLVATKLFAEQLHQVGALTLSKTP